MPKFYYQSASHGASMTGRITWNIGGWQGSLVMGLALFA